MPYCLFFAFDPKRKAIVLCGGNKKGQADKAFYKKMIKIADAEFASHLKAPEDKENGDA
ncbi:type II toxin-antitoxin system RelE/ParE family toxin [Enterobacter hormaechei]|nr:type II toxin-antitoxin system RelE/ParE family toxin [Enterobacter hormaechei]